MRDFLCESSYARVPMSFSYMLGYVLALFNESLSISEATGDGKKEEIKSAKEKWRRRRRRIWT